MLIEAENIIYFIRRINMCLIKIYIVKKCCCCYLIYLLWKIVVVVYLKIHLNTASVEAGYAWHYSKYSGKCKSAENLGWAEQIAREDKLGVWNGNHQKPWEFRRSANK